MVAKGIPYHNPKEYLFLDQKRKLGLVKRIQKQITKFDLKAEELGFATNGLLMLKFNVSQNCKKRHSNEKQNFSKTK